MGFGVSSNSTSEATQQTVSTQGDKSHAQNFGKKNQGATSIEGKAIAANGKSSIQEGGLQISSLKDSAVTITTDGGATAAALSALSGALDTAISNRDVITPAGAVVTPVGTSADAVKTTENWLSLFKPVAIGIAVAGVLGLLGWLSRKPKTA